MKDITKPCPFCGEDVDINLLTQPADGGGTPVALACGSCGAIGPWEYERFERQFFNKAKDLWNGRAS